MSRARSGSLAHRPLLVRWGLPREPRATELVLGFALSTVAAVVLTRGLLQLTGFPQVGGEGLHVAHVLWGGLAMALAVVLALSFAGPAIRPVVAVVGGIGFGLFIDEVGKFLTDDNDYFFQPAPMIMYVTLVVIISVADALHAWRGLHRSEMLAAAADYCVTGLAGGLSPHRRAEARAALEAAGEAPGHEEVARLLQVVVDDDEEAPDPVAAVRKKLRSMFRVVVRREWTMPTMLVLLGGLLTVSVVSIALGVARGAGPRWAVIVAGVSLLVVVGLWVRAWFVREDGDAALDWVRRGVQLNLLLTQVALFRLDPWLATAGLLLALAIVGVIGAERVRSEDALGIELDRAAADQHG